ncbi:hypothetical protein BSIN_4944 [Burkholderia singularis]|uniref:Uncharacterized protein n=1 Tax=Burkholderia singularis TaxID=1503053 RepID=A0A238HAG6_9BURK|nr:hypothetical protein BSIN_4944 [Burkholderia singularis]
MHQRQRNFPSGPAIVMVMRISPDSGTYGFGIRDDSVDSTHVQLRPVAQTA